MGSGTFRGGIHPYDGKEMSRDRAIQDIRPGKELAYLVSQHIGAPAKPIVKKGDRCGGTDDRRGRRLCIRSGLCIGIRRGKGN